MALVSAPAALSLVSMSAPALAQSASQSAAVTPINDLYTALKQIQSPSSGTSEARAQIMAPVIDRIFDLSTVLHNSIGMRYTTLSTDEQTRLLAAFRQFTIARYVSSFKQGGTAQFTVNPATRPAPSGGSTIVSTTIGDGSDSATAINYVMMPSGGGYRIVDILLNGHISQVAAQRADFSSTLARGGADALVTLLNRKTAKFMNN
ncbi:ABC transporter substrate-binding protein [Asaia krungthepensis]